MNICRLWFFICLTKHVLFSDFSGSTNCLNILWYLYDFGIDVHVNLSVGIRSTIGIMTMISANGGEVTQAQVAVFVKFFFLFRDVSTWRTQSGLKTIASMQLNAILSFSLHKLRWRARWCVWVCVCKTWMCVNVSQALILLPK